MDTMLDTIKTKPIKIEILDISPKNKAVLEFFFNNGGKSLFKKSNQDNADAFIIDYDFPGAKENWQNIFAATQKPAIVFSFKTVDLPYTISVAKPITAKTLANAGLELRKMLALHKTEVEPNSNNTLKGEKESVAISIKSTQAETALPENNGLSEENNELDKQINNTPPVEDTTATVEEIATSFPHINHAATSNHAPTTADQGETIPLDNIETAQSEQIISDNNAESNQEEPSIEDLLDELSNDLPDANKITQDSTNDQYPKTENMEKEPSIEDLLDDLSADLPASDEIGGANTENKIGLTEPDNTIPVVNNPILTSDTLSSTHNQFNKTESTTPHIMLEESDGTMISSDDEIEALLQSIQQRTDEKEEQLKSIEKKANNAKPVKSSRELTKAEKRWALLCGDIDDIADADDIKNMHSGSTNSLLRTKVRNISYNTKSHMFSYFLLAIKQAKRHLQVIEMRYINRTMVIDHALNCVYCDRTIYSDSFAKFCSEQSNQADLSMRIIKDDDEIRQYRKIIGLALDTTYSIESFIWTTSLLTSRGRLPQQLDITDIIKLKHWPDLTRVEQIPHAIRIAAVFYKHPGNLLEVAHWLHIPQRYVFAFYNAALALEMIETQKAAISKTPEPSFFEIEESTEKPKNRGLFSRLLTKLGAA